MTSNLKELKITERDLEKLTGFDINDVFIGSVFGGALRPSVFQEPKRLASFCLTEIFIFGLAFIFSIPIGLLTIRDSASAIDSYPVILRFLQLTIVVTIVVFISWNVYILFRIKSVKVLTHLLDEVDKYNEVIQAIALLDKLESVGNSQANLINRSEVIEALSVTRDTLVCGLMTEKILRENRGLLARRYDLFANIENNLITLRTLEVKNQANDYGQILNNALQIGMSVRQEMLKLSHRTRTEL